MSFNNCYVVCFIYIFVSSNFNYILVFLDAVTYSLLRSFKD
jgi:hypothetical protein